MLNLKQQKLVRSIAYTIEILIVTLMLIFGVAFHGKKKQLKEEQIKVKALTEQIDSLNRINQALGAENVLTVNVTFEMNQKNVLSFNQTNAQNIAKEVSTMTRKELYDSLYANKPKQ